MFNEHASGVYTIAATPFHSDGRVDTASINRLTDFYLECGVTGITVLGVMGEAPKLDAQESIALVTGMVKRAGQVPIVSASPRPVSRRCARSREKSWTRAPPAS